VKPVTCHREIDQNVVTKMGVSNDVFLENGATYYFANDQLGSGQALFDQYGQTVWQASYDPFGAATVSPDSTLVNNLRLPGQYFDSETGFHYNWHRYYEPGLGRYLSPDPIGFEGGMNLYAYVGGNPVNAVDPLGLTSASVAMRWVPMAVPFASAIAGVGTGLVMVGGAAVIVLATPTEFGDGTIPDIDWPKENEECKPKQCKPCNPPVGTIATDVH
jgi:RHS repeat-associated protein